jgi:hypothetical protein
VTRCPDVDPSRPVWLKWLFAAMSAACARGTQAVHEAHHRIGLRLHALAGNEQR